MEKSENCRAEKVRKNFSSFGKIRGRPKVMSNFRN